jgi:cytochrome c553
MTGKRSLAILAALLAAGGCQIEARDSVPPSQNGSLAAAIEAAHRRMHVRFGAALRMEQAIAHGDLDRAHAEAHTLAELDEPAALPRWRPYFEAIRDAARQVESTGGSVGAAQLTAMLGRRCARCHEASTARIVYPVEPAPAGDPKLVIQMLGHQWAAAQMWQGLIGPSEDRWLAGARALTTAPLNIVAQSVTPTSELDVDDIARVRLYANRALTMGSQDARAELFGTLLATCAHCHAVLRDR